MKRFIAFLAAVMILCGCREGTEEMTQDEKEVYAMFETMQKAMVEKDLDTLYAIVTEDKTFTHMSGKKQTKEEFFGEIADGTLNYYGYHIHDPRVTVTGDHATFSAVVTLDAKVYGMKGSWTLATRQNFIRTEDGWKICN